MQANRSIQSANQHILAKVAAFNVWHCLLVVLVVGIVVTMLGILVESNHQAELLSQGANALQEYQVRMQANPIESVSAYLWAGLQFQLPSAGGNLQAYGLAICYILAPLVLASLYALRLAGYKPDDGACDFATA